jgi:hypothetical protein
MNKCDAEEYIAAIRAARNMSVSDRFLAGPRMFDEGVAALCDKVKSHFPNATDVAIRDIVRE